jgi:hypothetical protein
LSEEVEMNQEAVETTGAVETIHMAMDGTEDEMREYFAVDVRRVAGLAYCGAVMMGDAPSSHDGMRTEHEAIQQAFHDLSERCEALATRIEAARFLPPVGKQFKVSEAEPRGATVRIRLTVDGRDSVTLSLPTRPKARDYDDTRVFLRSVGESGEARPEWAALVGRRGRCTVDGAQVTLFVFAADGAALPCAIKAA